jgi:hypothetical protein
MASNIVLADAQGTPVNHTFVPKGPDEKHVFYFEDQSAANANGFWQISASLTRPPAAQAGQSSNGRVFRVKIGLHEPVLETLGTNTVSGIPPAPTVSYVPRIFVESIIPERSALLDRKNLRKMMALLLAEAQMVNLTENLLMPF